MIEQANGWIGHRYAMSGDLLHRIGPRKEWTVIGELEGREANHQWRSRPFFTQYAKVEMHKNMVI